MIKLHYILDTYAWIEYFIGSRKGIIVKKILENNQNTFTILENCIAELCGWCLKERVDFGKSLSTVRSCSSIEPVNFNNWIQAARIKWEKRKRVKDFGLMDAIILAKQKELKCKIITGDRHFKNQKDVVFLG